MLHPRRNGDDCALTDGHNLLTEHHTSMTVKHLINLMCHHMYVHRGFINFQCGYMRTVHDLFGPVRRLESAPFINKEFLESANTQLCTGEGGGNTHSRCGLQNTGGTLEEPERLGRYRLSTKRLLQSSNLVG